MREAEHIDWISLVLVGKFLHKSSQIFQLQYKMFCELEGS